MTLLDLAPRQHAAATSLQRLEVRSPYGGRVVDLAVFSVGGVIGREPAFVIASAAGFAPRNDDP